MTAVAANTKSPVLPCCADAKRTDVRSRTEDICAQEIDLTKVSIKPDDRLESVANLQTETDFFRNDLHVRPGSRTALIKEPWATRRE